MAIITISHETFGNGRTIAERVAEILRYPCLSREVLVKASQRYGIAENKLVELLEEKPHRWWSDWLESHGTYRIALQAAICELVQEGNIVYHGRGGQEFFPGIRHVLNVFVETPTESRIQQVMARKGLAEEAAKKYLEESDRIRARRIKELFKIDWRDSTRYDLVINTAKIKVETAARMIAEVSQQEEYQPNSESRQAMMDLTIKSRVEAVLMVSSGLEISNLEVQTRHGEVLVSGVILAEGTKEAIVSLIFNIPGVTRVQTNLVVTPSEDYLYQDGS